MSGIQERAEALPSSANAAAWRQFLEIVGEQRVRMHYPEITALLIRDGVLSVPLSISTGENNEQEISFI